MRADAAVNFASRTHAFEFDHPSGRCVKGYCPESAPYFPFSSLACQNGGFGVSTIRRSPVQLTENWEEAPDGIFCEHQANRTTRC